MATPQGNVYSQGVRYTAVPTVPPPTTAPGPGSPVTLTTGQWIMDPTGNFVLILEANKGLAGTEPPHRAERFALKRQIMTWLKIFYSGH